MTVFAIVLVNQMKMNASLKIILFIQRLDFEQYTSLSGYVLNFIYHFVDNHMSILLQCQL